METKLAQVVIFSSGNQRNTIFKLSDELGKKNCKCTLWIDLFTRKDNNAKFALLPTLLKKIPTFDFAIYLTLKKLLDGEKLNDNVKIVLSRMFEN